MRNVPETVEKYDSNTISGYQNVGNYPEFSGHPESLKNRLNTAMRFDPDSLARLGQRVIAPIVKLEQELGLKFVLTDRDFPFHSTLQEAIPLEAAASLKLDVAQSLTSEIAKISSVTSLPGQEIAFDYLFVDKNGNAVLAATRIPETITVARDQISALDTSHGLKPLPLTNILHCSIARPARIPASVQDPYFYAMMKLSGQLHEKPLLMTVEKATVQTAWDLLHSQPPSPSK